MAASAGAVSSPEKGTWDFAPGGWEQLYGSFPKQGVSIEWHDFQADYDIPWENSFHDDSLEVCLNLKGTAEISKQGKCLEIPEQSVGFYSWRGEGLRGSLPKGEKHSFITIEFSKDYLGRILPGASPELSPVVKAFLTSRSSSQICKSTRTLDPALQNVVSGLRAPPVSGSALSLWYQSKILELATHLFFEAPTPPSEELFCARQKRVAQERVARVKELMQSNLENPISLQELGRQIGCSPFYLSRIFSQETGMSIPRFLRQIRIEKAAQLLKSGKCNVTEAAMEVGYSSASHFTKAFHETMGCCPGLYSIRKA
jgi:AraC family transcriptional regulator